MAGSQQFLPCSLQVGLAAGAAGAAAGLFCARATSAGTVATPNPAAAETASPNRILLFLCNIQRLLSGNGMKEWGEKGPDRSTAAPRQPSGPPPTPRTPVDTHAPSM